MTTLAKITRKKVNATAFFKTLSFEELERRCDDPVRDLQGGTEIQAILAFNNKRGFTLLAQDGKVLFSIRDAKGKPVQYRTVEQAIEVLRDVSGLSSDIRLDISDAWIPSLTAFSWT